MHYEVPAMVVTGFAAGLSLFVYTAVRLANKFSPAARQWALTPKREYYQPLPSNVTPLPSSIRSR